MRILVVEEDGISKGNEGLKKGLKRQGFAVDRLSNVNTLLSFIKTETFEVIILDLSLSKVSVLHTIRSAGITTPVLILTDNQFAKDKIKAFDHGADDYLINPIHLKEVCARIRAVQRRYSNNRASPLLTYRDIELDPSSFSVSLKGQPIFFTHREFNLLQKLIENVGQVVSRNSLNQCLYGWEAVVSNSLEVLVHNVRKKLGITNLIHTTRGIGYMIQKEN